VRTAVFVKQAPEYVTIFGPGRQSWWKK